MKDQHTDTRKEKLRFAFPNAREHSGKDYKKPQCDWAFKAALTASRCTHVGSQLHSLLFFIWQTICTGWFGQPSGTGWITIELCLCPAAGVCLDKCSRLVIICRRKLRMSKYKWTLESCKNKCDRFIQTPACYLMDKSNSKLEQQKSLLAVSVVIVYTYVAPKIWILCNFIKRNFCMCVIRPLSFAFDSEKGK